MNYQEPASAAFAFDNTYARELDGFFVPWQAAEASAPKMLAFNAALAVELGLDPDALSGDAGARLFAGNAPPAGAEPLAQVYAGHQFGGFSPQLGDGRALLWGEVLDVQGRRRDIQLKGSGRTPFSRNGDGLAAIGPVLREYLIGEAMHALGVPSTRALAAVATGDLVYREAPLPGAVLTRIAASHIRVGTFQYFAARGEVDKLKQLADYAIARHYPDAADADNPYLAFVHRVVEAQASLIAAWMSLGFIHGVMNTDNMTISGETIDYGPCAFMDAYANDTVFSSIDSQGRYAYGNQPPIAQWNLTRLAETLIPLVDENEEKAIEKLSNAITGFRGKYVAHWLARMQAKLGLATAEAGDFDLAAALFQAMTDAGGDFTNTFRGLSAALVGDDAPLKAAAVKPEAMDGWLGDWRERQTREAGEPAARAAAMNRVNPAYIPRNHQVEAALVAAGESDDMAPFFRLLGVVTDPFEDREADRAFAAPAPTDATPYVTFCGT